MRPQFFLPFVAVLLFACAAPEAPPADPAASAGSAPPIMIDTPAQGPNGGPNTDEEWARVTRLQRLEILARAEATPEAKARYALMMDCGRYAYSYGSRKFFDESKAGLPKNEACLALSDAASAAFYAEAGKVLTLNEMDAFQYFNSGLIQHSEEFRALGAAAAQRAYLQAKVEVCFAAPDLPAELSAALLTDCSIAPEGAPIVK